MARPATCLVTGATGFIGQRLCQRLRQEGHTVRVLVRGEVQGPWDEAHVCVLGRDSVDAGVLAGVDTVYHLAGVVHAMAAADVDQSLYHTVNVTASEALAALAAEAGVKQFIYFSSVKAVADPGDECVDESWQQLPHDPYGQSKREAEKRLFAIGRDRGMQVTALRPALVYGSSVKGNLWRMLRAIDAGRFPPLPDTGNQRSMVSVDDLIEAAQLAAGSPHADGQVYIVSDDARYSTRQMSDWMHEALGRKVRPWSIPVFILQAAASFGGVIERLSGRSVPLNPAVLRRLLGSACYRSDKLKNQLGWRPRLHFRDCLPGMVREYRALTFRK